MAKNIIVIKFILYFESLKIYYIYMNNTYINKQG